MKKKKLLFIYYKLWKPGGINRVLVNLVNELADDYDISILILMKDTSSFYELDKRVKIISIDSFSHWAFTKGCVGINQYFSWIPKKNNVKNYLYDYGAYKTVEKWLKENHQQFDLIIGCQYKISIQLAANPVTNNKSVAWEHTSHEVGGKFFNYLREKYYKKLKSIVTINKPSFEYYKSLNQNVQLISNIIGEPYESASFETNRENSICFVGRLDNDKNVSELVKIFNDANLPESWTLKIIGDGPNKDVIVQQVEELNLNLRVSLLGQKSPEEIIKILSNSKIFGFTSLREAFGMVLTEAMMCGNVLIAYDCNHGPADIINNKNGFLIPLGDKEKFIEVLKQLTSDEQRLNTLMLSSYLESQKWRKDTVLKKWKSIL